MRLTTSFRHLSGTSMNSNTCFCWRASVLLPFSSVNGALLPASLQGFSGTWCLCLVLLCTRVLRCSRPRAATLAPFLLPVDTVMLAGSWVNPTTTAGIHLLLLIPFRCAVGWLRTCCVSVALMGVWTHLSLATDPGRWRLTTLRTPMLQWRLRV